jgi:2-phosphosulfolactate phosphatase
MNTIEVCLSPALFPFKTTKDNLLVVVVDVLRATTAFCAAFDSGIEKIIPVSELEQLWDYKNQGFLTAAERDGKKVDFADFGNSPTDFLKHSFKGKQLAYSTTNGTQAVEMAKSYNDIALAAFTNLEALSKWVIKQEKNVLILCSGWKNTFSLEDTLCAGALAEVLELSGRFTLACDAASASLSLWASAKNSLPEAVKKANHYQRLHQLGQYNDLRYCFLLNSSTALPVWDGTGFIDLSLRK